MQCLLTAAYAAVAPAGRILMELRGVRKEDSGCVSRRIKEDRFICSCTPSDSFQLESVSRGGETADGIQR